MHAGLIVRASPYPCQCHTLKILNMPSQNIETQLCNKLSRLGIYKGILNNFVLHNSGVGCLGYRDVSLL